MRVAPLVPDMAPGPDANAHDSAGFARALDALGGALTGATRAEDAFAHGAGTLEAAVYERARADVALSVATATTQRVVQAVQSILNMQI
jgi:flagellar hook-basal body complex protein FliE